MPAPSKTTPEQRALMVAAYTAAELEGLSRNAAIDRARAVVSGVTVGRSTLRDYLAASDLPEARYTGTNPIAAAGRAAQRVYALEDFRRMEFELAELAEAGLRRIRESVRRPDGTLDPELVTEDVMAAAARVSVLTRRLAQMDADLDRRGGSSNPNPAAVEGDDADDLADHVAGAVAAFRVMQGGKA